MKKIFIAGHKGMVGSALVRLLKKKKVKLIIKDKKDLNLTNQFTVENFFRAEKFDQVYIAAAKVGGIYSNNTFPAEFIYENLLIEANIINSSLISGVKKLLFLGSSCMYPKFCKQPMKEEYLLSGPLEPTNEPYAIAKIAGIKLCESYNRQYKSSHNIDYRCLIPTNLYGPGDNYNLDNSHVIPALIRKFHEAKIKKKPKVIIWGTGNPYREFLHVDDLANACYQIMNIQERTFYRNIKPISNYINVGSGLQLRIRDLAKIIKDIVGYNCEIEFDANKPDGMQKKFLDSQRILKLGWRPKIKFIDGLIDTYINFKKSECRL
jgi:GDP-L-fucose synthase